MDQRLNSSIAARSLQECSLSDKLLQPRKLQPTPSSLAQDGIPWNFHYVTSKSLFIFNFPCPSSPSSSELKAWLSQITSFPHPHPHHRPVWVIATDAAIFSPLFSSLRHFPGWGTGHTSVMSFQMVRLQGQLNFTIQCYTLGSSRGGSVD